MIAQHRPDVDNMLQTVADFLNQLAPTLEGEARYHARVSVYLLEICRREIAAMPAPVDQYEAEQDIANAIRAGACDANWERTLQEVLASTTQRAKITRPDHTA